MESKEDSNHFKLGHAPMASFEDFTDDADNVSQKIMCFKNTRQVF